MIEEIVIFIIIIFVLCLLVSAADCHRFVTVEYEIVCDKLTRPCRLVLLSDLHNKSFGKENEKLLKAIDGISPDAVLVAGDMLTASGNKEYGTALALMKRLASRYRIYYGMGNHEYRLKLYPDQYGETYEEYMAGLKEAGIAPLVNESIYLPEYNLSVCGVEIDRRYYQRLRRYPMDSGYLAGVLGQPETASCQLLIAHNPEYFEEYAAWGADVVVSGHVHGGIMKLPFLGGVLSPGLTLFPRYDGGRFEKGRTTMILSRGLGTHTVPLRIFNPGELVVIHLKPGK
ncbi:MAG: metallophosphoesterase [Lachnospiraceae bacterium]|nr:metallophosphoesterase [Lachnospiraceae bacterium]